MRRSAAVLRQPAAQRAWRVGAPPTARRLRRGFCGGVDEAEKFRTRSTLWTGEGASRSIGVKEVSDPDYWQRLIPYLSISPSKVAGAHPRRLSDEHLSRLRQDIVDDGYFHIGCDSMEWAAELEPVLRAVHDLEAHGWNSTWLFLFDEIWDVLHRLTSIMNLTVRGRQVFDMYVFNIPCSTGAGWDIHRDRWNCESDLAPTFHEDGTPKYATVWIALDDATPLNSCIYCLPKASDKYYMGPDDPADYENPQLHAGVQQIRALPAARGDVYAWSHRLLHWGSASTSRALRPRVALSFSVAARGFEEPVLARGVAALPRPTWEERLVLSAYQLAMYSQHIPLGHTRNILTGLFRRHRRLLTKDAMEKLSPEVMDELFQPRRGRDPTSLF